jgi:hypothetical protein
VAAFLGTIAVLIAAVQGLVVALTIARWGETFYFHVGGFGSLVAAAMIVGGWITMAISGRWRPVATWLDRFGRLLGLLWIACAVAGTWLLCG